MFYDNNITLTSIACNLLPHCQVASDKKVGHFHFSTNTTSHSY